jgi:hypothetical protein
MSERLITLPQAAELLGISYGALFGRYTRREFGLPTAVADKSKRGTDLYRAADFIEYRKTGGKRRGLNNVLAQKFIRGEALC